MCPSLSCCQDSHFYEYPADYKRLRPVRPPPKPPVSKSVASDKPSAGEGGGNSSVSLNSEEVIELFFYLMPLFLTAHPWSAAL